MPIDANRAFLLRRSLQGVNRAQGRVLTLGVKALEDDLSGLHPVLTGQLA